MVARAFERDSLFSLIAGPLVWGAHFLTVYVFTALACARGFFDHQVIGIGIVQLVLAAVSLAAVLLIADALYLSWYRWRGDEPAGQPPIAHDRADVASRREFMAYAGLLLSAIALIATVWQTLPIFFFASCR
jgi:hypothetical protein